MTDLVNSPSHYIEQGPVECIEITEYMTSPNLAAAFQYVWRCDFKGTREKDLRKALWYLNRERDRVGFSVNAPISLHGVKKFNEWSVFVGDGLSGLEVLRVCALRSIWELDYRRDWWKFDDAITDVRDMLG